MFVMLSFGMVLFFGGPALVVVFSGFAVSWYITGGMDAAQTPLSLFVLVVTLVLTVQVTIYWVEYLFSRSGAEEVAV